MYVEFFNYSYSLPDHLVAHTLLLTTALRILLGQSIYKPNIMLAQELLDMFWQLHEKYYGILLLKYC